MADYDNRAVSSPVAVGVVDEGLRTYMLRVYNYMLAGLAITGIASYATFLLAVTTDPAAAVHLSNGRIAALPGGLMLTSIGALLLGPFMWVLLLGSLGLVLFLSFRIQHMSVAAARTSFLAYAALVGVTFGTLFIAYTTTSVAEVFFITAATFGAMSLYGYTTRADLSGWGSFLFMGLIGIILASLVNLFVASTALQFAVSVIGVLIFAGLTAYDTQQIKEMYSVNDDGSVSGRKAVMGPAHVPA